MTENATRTEEVKADMVDSKGDGRMTTCRSLIKTTLAWTGAGMQSSMQARCVVEEAAGRPCSSRCRLSQSLEMRTRCREAELTRGGGPAVEDV